MIKAWGGGSWNDLSDKTQSAPHEAKILRLDITKAVTTLQWKPTWTVPSAIAHTIAWYRARHSVGPDFNAHAFSLEQIETFTAADRDGYA